MTHDKDNKIKMIDESTTNKTTRSKSEVDNRGVVKTMTSLGNYN